MGVMGTWCQICGIPVQQDHYVELEGMLGIYRGGMEHEVCEPAVAFGPEHAWLKRAVGLRCRAGQEPAVIRGEVHDGYFDGEHRDGMVMDGIDDRVALHEACWKLAGSPDRWQAIPRPAPPRMLQPYQEQLFEFERFVADGHGWMLADPEAQSADGKRSRERILALLGKAPPAS